MRRIVLLIILGIFAATGAIALWPFPDIPVSTADYQEAGKQVANAAQETEHEHSDGKQGARDADAEPKGKEGESHEEFVKLSAAQLQEFGIELDVASPGPIAIHLERPAEIKFDGDRLNHVGPRVDGIVSDVSVTQGQNVAKDEPLAVHNSRELAELKATYLAALERRNLLRETFERENRLWEKKVSSEKDYLEAKASLAEAEIALRAAGQKLRALGFTQQNIDALSDSASTDLTKYELLAPIAGTVIERHLTLGEAVSADKEVFVIADASAVWIEVTIYPKDMSLVRAGQTVSIDIDDGDDDPIEGQIQFVTPHLNEQTRTGTARVVIDSANGRLKPGMFVKASIEVGQEAADVRIPKSAIQNYENGPVVFVQDGEQFEPRPIRLGRENALYVEVASGVDAGEKYVTKGAFTLKAELEKASFGDGHGH